MVAVYCFEVSMVIGGGAEYCLGELVTAAPWATGELRADGEGDAAGLGKGLRPVETWAAEAEPVGARVGVGAAGAAL
jgi:hypothetical protein